MQVGIRIPVLMPYFIVCIQIQKGYFKDNLDGGAALPELANTDFLKCSFGAVIHFTCVGLNVPIAIKSE